MSIKEHLIEVGKFMMDKELAWGNSGNISARNRNKDFMIMSGSGTYMGDLNRDDLVEVNIKTGEWQGSKRPSKEIPMHKSIYTARDDAQVILHSSPFWSTLAACSDVSITSHLFIESMYYLKEIEYVDYYHPGSELLGKEIGEKAKNANVIMLRNHGIVVFDKNFYEAKMRLETLELTIKMIIVSKASDVTLTKLSEDTVRDFLENSGYK